MSDLPPLPESAHLWSINGLTTYTAEQMQAYASAAVAAEREACARECERITSETPWRLHGETPWNTCTILAAAIRARGDANAS